MDEITVKELRAKTGMSQREFADHFEFNVRTLQGWEAGKRPHDGIVPMIRRIIELEEELEGARQKIVELEKLKSQKGSNK